MCNKYFFKHSLSHSGDFCLFLQGLRQKNKKTFENQKYFIGISKRPKNI